MSARFVNIDHDTPMFLPPELRDWLPADHMVHFIKDAIAALDLSRAHTNERCTGSAQYRERRHAARLAALDELGAEGQRLNLGY